MATATSFVPTSELVSAGPDQAVLPRGCTFPEADWRALAPFWYPVAFSHEVTSQPHATTLLDERVVVYRLSDGELIYVPRAPQKPARHQPHPGDGRPTSVGE